MKSTFLIIIAMVFVSCGDNRISQNHEYSQSWPIDQKITEEISNAIIKCQVGMPMKKFYDLLDPYKVNVPCISSGPQNNTRSSLRMIDGRIISFSFDQTTEDHKLIRFGLIGYKKDPDIFMLGRQGSLEQ